MKKERLQKKRTPWLEVTLTCSIVLLIYIIITFTIDNSIVQNIISANNHQSTIEVTDTDFENIKMTLETSNDSSLSYRLVYPKTEFETFNETVHKYITDAKNNYISNIRKKDDKEGHLNIDCTIYPYKENYYSIVFSKIETYDFSNYDTQVQTYFIDKNNGNMLQLHNILTDNASHFTALSKYVQNQLLQSKELAGKITKDTIVKAASANWKNYSQFAIINNQLVLYFNLTNEQTGEQLQPTVKINIPFINPIMLNEFQSKQKSSKTILTKPKPKPKQSPKKNVKRVALTFDDGPHKTVTKEILKVLDKYDAKATFFMLGNQVKKNKDVLKEVKKRGHEIGNHSYSHKNLTKLKPEQVLLEVKSTNAVIKSVIGEEATVFRPPYGATTDEVDELVKLPVALWTVDTLDWKYRNKNKLLPVVKNSVRNNSIILMHDIHQSTADGLDSVLAYLKKQGYEFVTVSEIIENP